MTSQYVIGGCSALALALASAAHAQTIDQISARIAPQYHSYEVRSPSNLGISEFSVPLFVLVPVSQALSFDIGTAYAHTKVRETAAGQLTTSSVAGLTDTQLRANYTFGNDFVVLTGGVNLPTGKSTVTQEQRLAAGLIGSDFLSFPISNMGTGFGGTGGVAVARPVGDWNVGFGASMRHAAAYDPFDATGGATFHYQPGNDNLAGSIYNTGNRWITQAGYDNALGDGVLTFAGWNLFRTAGTLADSSYLPHEDIANAALSYGLNMRSMLVEPNVEGRTWFQGGGLPTSFLWSVGLRSQMNALGFAVVPSVQYSLGRLASQDQTGLETTAAMTGWHATLVIRLR
jgi:hypothetical protein